MKIGLAISVAIRMIQGAGGPIIDNRLANNDNMTNYYVTDDALSNVYSYKD